MIEAPLSSKMSNARYESSTDIKKIENADSRFLIHFFLKALCGRKRLIKISNFIWDPQIVFDCLVFFIPFSFSLSVKNIAKVELRKIHVCQNCCKSITDDFILRLSPSSEWHTQCLNCETCGVNLSFATRCYIKDGRPYCRMDYQR